MIVLNDHFDERMPTKLTNTLVNFFPLDGNLHCKVYNTKYFRVLSVRSQGTELYDYFFNAGAVVTTIDGDINAQDLSRTVKGKYNLIAIDANGISLTAETIKKLETLAKSNAVSIVALCDNDHYKYIYGGQSLLCNKFINKRFLKQDFMQRSEVYKSFVNMKFEDEYAYFIGDGKFEPLIDTTYTHDFTVSLDVAADTPDDNSVITFSNSGTTTLSIVLNSSSDTVKITGNGVDYEWKNNPHSLTEFNKLIITSDQKSANIYINRTLIHKTNTPILFDNIVIGVSSTLVNSKSNISFKELAIYDEALNDRDREILVKGALIFD